MKAEFLTGDDSVSMENTALIHSREEVFLNMIVKDTSRIPHLNTNHIHVTDIYFPLLHMDMFSKFF